ncbi:hypothetical protein J1N10_09625 [Carboxylicivirga sp. A043]|uniref:hypothetical protein n=1 Tax=Carboxylicivirga litoralis TaxID=2816963 RepID=UPI0021CB7629|nr:hypothetical protein [Carboxylicivirga sp. A043]MCU4156236.1 hypothetical protein [Carboxylicivirga sp. A043]
MKKVKWFICLMVVVAMVGCSDDDETCERLDEDFKPEECKSDNISVCSDDDGGRYFIFNGETYDTSDELSLACSPQASAERLQMIKMEFDEATLKLFNEARSAAICD